MASDLRPQAGPQERFLASPADIAIYGGAAGGGKSFALLMEPLRHMRRAGFNALLLRKNYVQLTLPGGLLDESTKMYSPIAGAKFKSSPRTEWTFPDGASVSFSHLERDAELFKYQGAQIALIGFDELTHFTEKQFFYMLSRNRSACGVKPYVRATCNPDNDSWVANFISWWWDPDTGYPIPERSGKLRWMIRRDERIYWADTPQELWAQFGLKTPEEMREPKSVTFIASTIYDNQILLHRDPSYLANLKALPLVDRERLLNGNWKIRPQGGLIYKGWHKEEFDWRKLLYTSDGTGHFEWEARFGLDFGFSIHPTAFIGLLVNRKRKEIRIFEDSIYRRGMTNREIFDAIHRLEFHKAKIVADKAELRTINELKILGLNRIIPCKKGPDSVRAGIQRLQDFTIFVDPRCQNAIYELSNYVWKQDSAGNYLDEPLKENDHLMDALRYATEDITKENFKVFGA
jgi:phage terminase large subunit